MPKINYLTKDKNGNYSYRRKAPDELRGILEKREFKASLKTKDYATAKSKLATVNLKVEEQLAAAYRELEKQKRLIRATKRLEDLEPHEVERISMLWFKRAKDRNDEILAGIFAHDDFSYSDAIENVKDTLVMLDEIGHPTTLRWIDEEVGKALRTNNLSADKDLPNYKRLQQFIYEGLKELEEQRLKEYYQRLAIRTSANIASNKRFKDADSITSLVPKTPQDITLAGLIQTYLNDPHLNHLSDKGRYEYEKKLKFLTQMLGKDMRANAIKRQDMIFVVGILKQLPKGSAGKCTAKSYEGIIKKARKEGKPPITANTVNHYIDLYSNLFTFAKDEGLIERIPTKRIRLQPPSNFAITPFTDFLSILCLPTMRA